FEVAEQIRETWPEANLVERPVAFMEWEGAMEAYGTKIGSGRYRSKLGIMEYETDAMRLNVFDAGKNLGTSERGEKLIGIYKSAIDATVKVHAMNYTGGGDFNLSNFRIARNPDGTYRIFYAGDFEGYDDSSSEETIQAERAIIVTNPISLFRKNLVPYRDLITEMLDYYDAQFEKAKVELEQRRSLAKSGRGGDDTIAMANSLLQEYYLIRHPEIVREHPLRAGIFILLWAVVFEGGGTYFWLNSGANGFLWASLFLVAILILHFGLDYGHPKLKARPPPLWIPLIRVLVFVAYIVLPYFQFSFFWPLLLHFLFDTVVLVVTFSRFRRIPERLVDQIAQLRQLVEEAKTPWERNKFRNLIEKKAEELKEQAKKEADSLTHSLRDKDENLRRPLREPDEDKISFEDFIREANSILDSKPEKKRLMVGISGTEGSGKRIHAEWAAREFRKKFPGKRVRIIPGNSFFKEDQRRVEDDLTNPYWRYDMPRFNATIGDLGQNGPEINPIPIYDSKHHARIRFRSQEEGSIEILDGPEKINLGFSSTELTIRENDNSALKNVEANTCILYP
ncbi:hypothetical protein BVX98_01475, partial [bacterium F11]